MPKAKFSIGIGFANCRQEEIVDIDETEWEACETQDEKDTFLYQYWEEWSQNYIDCGFELID